MYIRPSFSTLVPDGLKTQEMCYESVCIDPWLLHDVSNYLKTQEMCNKAIKKAQLLVFHFPDRFRNLRMNIRAIHPLRFITPGHPKTHGSWNMSMITSRWRKCVKELLKKEAKALGHVSDHFKAQEMYIKAVKKEAKALGHVPDHFEMQEMCDKAVKDDSSSLQLVPDWFIIRGWIDMWYDDYYDGDHWDDDGDYWDDNKDKFFEWYGGYQKRKTQKAQIKKELMPILGIHQGIGTDVCKKMRKKR